jgi:plastocyanin
MPRSSESLDMSRHRAHPLVPAAAVAGTVGGLLLLAACGTADKPTAPAARSPQGVTVGTGLLAFSPQTVKAKAGQTVTWVGGDNITHVLVQGSYVVGADGLRSTEKDDGTFQLRLNRKGQQVSHTYTTPGTFTYFCSIHRGMNGTVVVS